MCSLIAMQGEFGLGNSTSRRVGTCDRFLFHEHKKISLEMTRIGSYIVYESSLTKVESNLTDYSEKPESF